MDPTNGDSQMLDAPGNASHAVRESIELRDPALNKTENSITGLIHSRQLHQQNIPNINNGAFNLSVKRSEEDSREPSMLANSVATNLSIGNHNEDADGHDTDGEREPTAPYNSSLPTILCYDVRMRYHCELDPPKQRLDYHPEDPRRIFKIYKELCIAGLVKDEFLNTGTVIPNPLMTIPAREVTEAEVCLVHDKKHFDFMQSTASKDDDYTMLGRG
ncbi:Histone deacetylase hda1 [Lecanora helva]